MDMEKLKNALLQMGGQQQQPDPVHQEYMQNVMNAPTEPQPGGAPMPAQFQRNSYGRQGLTPAQGFGLGQPTQPEQSNVQAVMAALSGGLGAVQSGAAFGIDQLKQLAQQAQEFDGFKKIRSMGADALQKIEDAVKQSTGQLTDEEKRVLEIVARGKAADQMREYNMGR